MAWHMVSVERGTGAECVAAARELGWEVVRLDRLGLGWRAMCHVEGSVKDLKGKCKKGTGNFYHAGAHRTHEVVVAKKARKKSVKT